LDDCLDRLSFISTSVVYGHVAKLGFPDLRQQVSLILLASVPTLLSLLLQVLSLPGWVFLDYQE